MSPSFWCVFFCVRNPIPPSNFILVLCFELYVTNVASKTGLERIAPSGRHYIHIPSSFICLLVATQELHCFPLSSIGGAYCRIYSIYCYVWGSWNSPWKHSNINQIILKRELTLRGWFPSHHFVAESLKCNFGSGFGHNITPVKSWSHLFNGEPTVFNLTSEMMPLNAQMSCMRTNFRIVVACNRDTGSVIL